MRSVTDRLYGFFYEYRQLFILFVCLLPVRLYGISNPLFDTPASFRQAQTATVALNYYKTGIDLFRSELDIFGLGREKYLTLEFPIYQALVSVFFKLFSVSDFWGRVVSVFFGYVGALYLYRLILLLEGNRRLALVSGVFFLFAPVNVVYHRAFLTEPMVISLLLAGFYYSVCWLKTNKTGYFISGILLLSLSYLQKAVYGPFWLLPLYSLFVIWKRRLYGIGIFLLIFLPLLVVSLWQRHADQLNIINNQAYFASTNPQLIIWNFGLLEDRFSGAMWSLRLDFIFKGIFLKPGIIFFLIGLIEIKQLKKRIFWVSFLLSQAIYFLALFRIQSHDYYQMVMVPSISVFMALGVSTIKEFVGTKLNSLLKEQSKLVGVILMVFLLTVYIWRSWVYARWNFEMDWDKFRSLRVIAESLPEKSNGILITEGYNWNSLFTYYTGKKMLLLETEKATEEKINNMRVKGYSFIMLENYRKYPEYLKSHKVKLDFEYLSKHNLVYEDEQFKVYLFK